MRLVTYTSRLKEADLAALILRLMLGVTFILHGGQKWFGWFGGPGWNASVHGISQMTNVPPWLAMLAIVAEFAGGISVLVGFLTRLGALGIAIDMVVAVLKVHLKNGFFFTPQKPGYEFALSMFAMALALVIYGAGRYSIDAAFATERGETKGPLPTDASTVK